MNKIILAVTCLAFSSLATVHAGGGCTGCSGDKAKEKDKKEQTEQK